MFGQASGFPTRSYCCLWWTWPRMPKVPKMISLQYLRNISNRWLGINMICCMKMSIKVFCKLTISFLLVVSRHAQSTQNSKFVISLEYIKKGGKDETDFAHQDKYIFCRLILLILVGMARHVQITQNNKFAKSLWYL